MNKLRKIKAFSSFLIVFTAFLFFLANPSKTYAQIIEWTDQFGSGSIFDEDIDSANNVYVVGKMNGAFIRKEDENGNGIWTHQFTLYSSDNEANAVDEDGAGNIYIAGTTSSNAGGSFYDAFVRKYDSNGNVQWTQLFGFGLDATNPAYNSTDQAFSIATDGNYVYVGGLTTGIIPGQTFKGGIHDGFLRKFDTNGNVIWSRQLGTTSSDSIRTITTDEQGNIYLILSSPTKYLIKFDPDGNQLWSQPTVNGYIDIEADDNGHIYLAGDVNGALDGYIGQGGYDGFVMKKDTQGNTIWAHQFGTSFNDQIRGLSVRDNNIVIAGHTFGILEGQIHYGQSDSFVRLYDSNGSELWSYQFGDSGTDELWGVGLINENSILVAGRRNAPNPLFISRVSLMPSNQLPNANAGLDQTVFEGQAANFDGSGSTDPDGAADMVSYNWDFGDGGTASGQIVNHTYLDNGTYTATLTVTDTANQTNSDTAMVTVNNAAPVIGSISPVTPVLPGVLINVSASFADAGILDSHFASWDWGDGNVTAGVVTESGGAGSISGSHAYSAPGTYTITLTVSDGADAASGTIGVTILTPAQATQDLIDLVETFNLQQGIENSLDAKLDNAISALTDLNQNNNQAAINSLGAFINAVNAQRGSHITDAQADQLIHDAQLILNSL